MQLLSAKEGPRESYSQFEKMLSSNIKEDQEQYLAERLPDREVKIHK